MMCNVKVSIPSSALPPVVEVGALALALVALLFLAVTGETWATLRTVLVFGGALSLGMMLFARLQFTMEQPPAATVEPAVTAPTVAPAE